MNVVIKFLAVIGVLAIIFAVYAYHMPTDSTDKGRWKRSGMRLHVDQDTGINYLSTLRGGLVPRLHPDGSLYISTTK